MEVANGHPSINLPVTLDWYRDTFKWFVALAAGILAFSVTLVKDHPIESNWTRNSFLLVCISFGSSAASGVLAYLWAVRLGNLRENQGKKKRESDDDPSSLEKARSEEDPRKAKRKTKDDTEIAEGYLGLFYNTMLYTFLCGVPAFAVLAWSLLLPKKASDDTPKHQDAQISILLGEVGPFAPASSSLSEACDKRNDISSIVFHMSRRSKDLDYIILVGSADQRQIKTGASNRTLAIRRTLWTEYCLRQQLAPPLDSIMMTHSVNGPINLNTRREELLAEDRRVSVYAVMRNTSGPQQPPSKAP